MLGLLGLLTLGGELLGGALGLLGAGLRVHARQISRASLVLFGGLPFAQESDLLFGRELRAAEDGGDVVVDVVDVVHVADVGGR